MTVWICYPPHVGYLFQLMDKNSVALAKKKNGAVEILY